MDACGRNIGNNCSSYNYIYVSKTEVVIAL